MSQVLDLLEKLCVRNFVYKYSIASKLRIDIELQNIDKVREHATVQTEYELVAKSQKESSHEGVREDEVPTLALISVK